MKQRPTKSAKKSQKETTADVPLSPTKKRTAAERDSDEEIGEKIESAAKRPAIEKGTNDPEIQPKDVASSSEQHGEVKEAVTEHMDKATNAPEIQPEDVTSSLEPQDGAEDNEVFQDDDFYTETESEKEKRLEKKKKKKAKGIKYCDIPAKVRLTRIIHALKLHKNLKQKDIVEAFQQFGQITHVHILQGPKRGKAVNIAYSDKKYAEAAVAAETVNVKNCIVKVGAKRYIKNLQLPKESKEFIEKTRDRTVYVKNIKHNTTEEQIKTYFEGCGKISRCKCVIKNSTAYAFVTFSDKESITAAMQLHNTIFNEATIGVYENTLESISKMGIKDPKKTVMLRNKQHFRNIDGKILQRIFEKCGEIENLDILCKRNILAFISFKTEEAAKNALNLNGTTEEGMELEVEVFDPDKKRTAIHVLNLPRECTDDDLRNHFSSCGEISKITHKDHYVILEFKNSDGYCKSFLLNETYIKSQIIFVEPHSPRKQGTLMAIAKKIFRKSNGSGKRKGKKSETSETN